MREAIKVHESSVDERRYRAVLDEQQILDVLAGVIAAQAGVDLEAKNVSLRTVHLSSRVGSLSTTNRYEAVVEIVVDQRPQDKGQAA